MATNKNAIVRYRALDKCFSSRTRKYYMNDLIEACRMALERQNGDSGSKGAEGVQRRQIFDDMNDMELMYGVTIDRIQDGHKKYFFEILLQNDFCIALLFLNGRKVFK